MGLSELCDTCFVMSFLCDSCMHYVNDNGLQFCISVASRSSEELLKCCKFVFNATVHFFGNSFIRSEMEPIV